MGRRWVVEIDRGMPESVNRVYLRRFSLYAGLPGHPDDEPCDLPVTVTYATRFATKREAQALAVERGLAGFTVKRTWW